MSSVQEPTCDVNATCYCPLANVVNVLGRKYAMQLFSIISAQESLRFVEIENELSKASTSTISKRLDEFEEVGLISRTQFDEIPPHVEYELTEKGKELRNHLKSLLEWKMNESN
ncbi:MAG: winged helix-turn-helix transcriptional regulator [Halobacteriaceae archaeon]